MKHQGTGRGRRLAARRPIASLPIYSIIEPLEDRCLFSTYTVNTLSDAPNPGTGLLSLRQAVADANAHAGADTINFSASLFATSGQKSITLTQGEIDFKDTSGATTVTGPGAAKLAINARHASRVFDIAAKATVTVSGLTVFQGSALPGSDTDGRGGGIYNAGTLALSAVTVSNCSAGTLAASLSDISATTGQGLGGGIYSVGPLTLQSCAINANSATGAINEDGPQNSYGGMAAGGAIYSTAALKITACNISNNNATGGAAGLYNGEDSFGGSASGGAIFSTGTLAISNSTLANDSANGGTAASQDTSGGGSASGGAIWASGSITVTGTAFSNNSATAGAAPVGNFPNGASLAYGGSAGGGAIFTTATLSVSSGTFTNNAVFGGAGGEEFFDGNGGDANGGAIDALATVSLTSSTFTKNAAHGGDVGGDDFGETGGTARGGAIAASGSTTLQSCSVTQNYVEGGDAISWAIGGDADGGGIFLQTSTVHLLDSTVASNTARGGDSANDAGTGGINGGNATAGIYAASGTVRLIDSTIAANAATGGAGSAVGTSTNGGNGGNAIGGLFSAQGLQIYDSTISANSATGGAGGAVGAYGGTAGAKGSAVGGLSNPSAQGLLDNTIVSANKGNGAFNDIAGHVLPTSAYNLIGVGGGLTNGVNGNKTGVTDPKLSALGNYGGPTQTMYPMAGSPALASGSTALIPTGFNTDQRGFPRTVNGKVDIGSVEVRQITITGNVYDDLNGDGVHQANEVGLGDWKIYIDLKNTGSYVVGDPIATSNSRGNYTLTFSPITVSGPLIVREIHQTGWRATQPSAGYYSVNQALGTVSNINFGNKP
ncbi:MAG TPA: choice-of-anchor Q domain-containing protein [Tepidisphaeraceae bacterium]|jgi:hypothetical protein|nr:choice-of-anchor Q domain-containing protein [Tepidisphaeraceae bacterium]